MHSLFLEYFLLTASNFAAPDPFDFCDPFKLAGEEVEEDKKASVSIDEWVEVKITELSYLFNNNSTVRRYPIPLVAPRCYIHLRWHFFI